MPATFARILTYDEATSIQTALNTVAHANLVVDGHFGELSKLALIRFKHDHGIVPEDDSPTLATTEALGIPPITTPGPAPAPKLTPNPIVQFIAGLALKAALNQLKGLPIVNMFAGYKTIAIGLVGIAIGVFDLIGWNIPDTGSQSAGMWIAGGLGAIFLRLGVNNALEQAVLKIVGNLGSK